VFSHQCHHIPQKPPDPLFNSQRAFPQSKTPANTQSSKQVHKARVMSRQSYYREAETVSENAVMYLQHKGAEYESYSSAM
jgi:hypothetical protein